VNPRNPRLAIVGRFGGTHIGGSLKRAADELGIETLCFDAAEAMSSNRLLQLLAWRLADRRPVHMARFGRRLLRACDEGPPGILVATGSGPLERRTLQALRRIGVVAVNYSTDDPWNPALFARWHLEALPHYDIVFTPRSSNIEDLRRLGCRDVRRMAFGYDETLSRLPETLLGGERPDVLFVGGADRDRLAFMAAFMTDGLRPALVGGYWNRYRQTRDLALGVRSPDEIRDMTVNAKVNLCLVRRANRDGHVMRTFEIAALGGCMLAEDTDEHREIFGADGEAVFYFDSPEAAAGRARQLIADESLRRRLSAAVRQRIVAGRNTYRDRLSAMIAATGSADLS
jgi:spore maturation protein CgeB